MGEKHQGPLFSVVKHEGHGSLDAEHDETPGHQGDKQAHHQHK